MLKWWLAVFLSGLGLLKPSWANLAAPGYANNFLLDKQRFILEILQRVEEPLLNVALVYGHDCQLVLDRTEYAVFNVPMQRFNALRSNNELLSRDLHFTPFDRQHYSEALGLFYFLYHVMTWQSLRSNICWARVHVNPGMFVFALTQTLLKRDDYNGLIVPKVYELLPELFYEARLVRQAQRFDYGAWCLHELEYNEKHQYGLFEHCDLQPANLVELRNNSAWHAAMLDVQRICLRPHEDRTYSLLADMQWNAHWYYLNMGIMLTNIESDVERNALRDWWYWQLGQIVARYKLEAPQSNQNQKPTPLLNWNGLPLTNKTNRSELLHRIVALTRRAIDEGRVRLPTGRWVSLALQPQQWSQFFHAFYEFDILKLFASTSPMDYRRSNYMQNLETMLQHPQFYADAELLLQSQHQLKSHFQPYQRQQLMTPGVQINAVNIGGADADDNQLLTFYTAQDLDITNLLSSRHFYFNDLFMWLKTLQARKNLLQHRPFQLVFNVSATRPQAVVVRSFLTSAAKECVNDCSFLQLDTFVTYLALGYNIIERESRDFFRTIGPHISYSELYHYNRLALAGGYDFPLNISTPHCGFPNRLLLPQGTLEGREVRLVFVVTPYSYKLHMGRNLDCNFGSGITHFDDLPQGFPFDREWAKVGPGELDMAEEDEDDTWYMRANISNIYWIKAKIFHQNKLD